MILFANNLEGFSLRKFSHLRGTSNIRGMCYIVCVDTSCPPPTEEKRVQRFGKRARLKAGVNEDLEI